MKKKSQRVLVALAGTAALAAFIALNPNSYETSLRTTDSLESSATNPVANSSASDDTLAPLGESTSNVSTSTLLARDLLDRLEVKGRSAKTGYDRTKFYSSWPTLDGCSLRQRIIKRELGDSAVLDSSDNCTVVSGEFDEPYTGSHMIFYQKSDFTKGLQIDHVVALSDAWQKGAKNLSSEERYNLATDPLNLLAVDSKTNQGKSDGDAATWLPPNKKFRCTYVARQVSVKYKYSLWVTSAEKSAIESVLESCPNEPAVGITE
ncbi:HNH endonuclease [Candidatus Saccharibacteria bacterium]|nr:HNH endonuclease [Candidatus Saccharibacteria bacterium]